MTQFADLTLLSVSPLDLVIRGAAVYFVVILLLRMAGKRQLGQMGATEFVALLLISNAVQNSMNGGDNSLVGGILLAVVLVSMSWLITRLTYFSKAFSIIFEGTPSLLIHKGKIIQKNLIKERMTPQEVRTLLRKQGIHHLHEVQIAILETDGSLSVTRAGEEALT